MTPRTFTVRASCPDCGEVNLTADQILVLQCVDTHEGSYTFQCPCCSLRVARQASSRIVEMLLDAGCGIRVWWLPAELFETHDGPPLTFADVGRFNVWLEQL